MNNEHKKLKNTLLSVLLLILLIFQNVEGALNIGDVSGDSLEISNQFVSLENDAYTIGDKLFNSFFVPNYTPTSDVTISPIGSVFLGSDFDLELTFQNNGNTSDHGSTGYGPFIDIYIPRVGVDGVHPDETTYDGITYASSQTNYQAWSGSEELEVISLTFPEDTPGSGTGCVDHPWALDASGYFLEVCGDAGDQLLSIKLPYGSYTLSQPPIDVRVPLHLEQDANLGTILDIKARGGYQYGATPLVDWCCTTPPDTTILSDYGSPPTWNQTGSVNPAVITLSKSSNDGETVTGPNYPATYTITVSMAEGQLFTQIELLEELPNNIVVDMDSLSSNPPYSGATFNYGPLPPGEVGPANNQELRFYYDGPIQDEIQITFDYYIPEFDANGISTNGVGVDNIVNLVSATWTPTDGSPDVVFSSPGIPPGVASADGQDVTVTKSGSVSIDGGGIGPTPGDVYEYTVSFEVSDYFGFDNIHIDDVLPDGLHYHESVGRIPTVTIQRDGVFTIYNFDSENVFVSCNYTGGSGLECDADDPAVNTGETALNFDIFQELIDRGVSSQILGDNVDDGNGTGHGSTTVSITYYAQLLDKYIDTHSGEPLKMNDSLTNDAILSATLLNTATCNPGPCVPSGTSINESAQAPFTIPHGEAEKTIVAVNGTTCGANLAACTDVKIAAGDTVTYRITYEALSGDFYELSFTDFLPLPIFHADDPNVDGVTGWSKHPVDGVAPVDGGLWTYGPDHDYSGLVPDPSVGAGTIIISGASNDNSLKFDFGSYDDSTNIAKTVDFVFTVRVTSEKFGDDLRMRNSVLTEDSNSPGILSSDINNIDLTLTEPILVNNKTAVSTDNPNATIESPADNGITFTTPGVASDPWNTGTPINSQYLDSTPLDGGVDGVDGGDLVKFAIIIENVGTGVNGAFDIAIKDVLPSGYIIPANATSLNLQAYRGDGTQLTYEYLGTTFTDETDFFEDGIRLNDPPATDPEYGSGACQQHDDTNGKNVIIITYDLMVDPDIFAGQLIENNGQVTNYAGEEGGDNHLPEPDEDESTTEIAVPTVDKELIGTEINNANNASNRVVIGEYIYYRVTVILPEAIMPNSRVVDTLDNGLVFVSNDSFLNDAPADVIFTGSTADPTVGPTPTVSSDGRTITWDFGDIENSANSNTVDETFVLEYTAMVTDVDRNQRTNYRNNNVDIRWDTTDADGNTVLADSVNDSAPNVRIIESDIDVSKSVIPTQTDAGNNVQYTIVIDQGANSDTDAFDLTFTDSLPQCTSGASAIQIVDPLTALIVTDTAGLVDNTDFELVGSNAAGWTLQTTAGTDFDFSYDSTRTITLTVDGSISYCVNPDQTLTNTATVYWTSMDGVLTNRSVYGTTSVNKERTGSGGVDDYTESSSVDVDIDEPTLEKSIVASTDAETVGNDLSIGEIATYRLDITLPQGTSNDVTITDILPAVLSYEGNPRITVLSDIDMTLDALLDGANNGAVPPTHVIPSSFITVVDAAEAGDLRDITFSLGDIINNDLGTDGNVEKLIVEFDAKVMDHSLNVHDAIKSNNFTVEISGSSHTSPDVDARIVEPVLTVEKSSTLDSNNCEYLSAPGAFFPCIGATIGYTITTTNDDANSGYIAWDTIISDAIPAGMTIVNGTLVAEFTPSGGSAGVVGTAGSGWILDFTAPAITLTAESGIRFDLNDMVRITYQTTIDDNASDIGVTPVVDNIPQPTDVLSNTVDADWTSVDGPSTEERTYNDNDTENVTVENGELIIIKTDDTENVTGTPAQLVAGDTIYYLLSFENTGNVDAEFIITESLPDHTTYDAATTDNINSMVGSWIFNTTSGLYEASPDIGDGTGNLNAGSTGSWYFVVTIDDPLQAGVVQIENTSIIYLDEDTGGPEPKPGDNESKVVISANGEPDFTIVKDNGLDIYGPNDLLIYEITYQNVGNQNATGVVLLETVPDGTTFVSASSDPAWICTDVVPGSTCEIAIGNLNAGDPAITVNFAIRADSPITQPDTDNIAVIEDDGNNTDGSTTPITESDNDKDYALYGFDKFLININEPAAGTFDSNGNDVAIGAIMTYQLDITIPAGDTMVISVENVVIEDILDQGLAFVGCGDGSGVNAISLSPGSVDLTTDQGVGDFSDLCDQAEEASPPFTLGTSPTVSEYPNGSIADVDQGRRLNWNFGTVTNLNAAGQAQTISIVYRVVVLNDENNVQGSGERTNYAILMWKNAIEGLDDSAESVEIVEPNLNLSKTVNHSIVPIGGTITYTLDIFHEADSTSIAYEVNVFDTIPDGLSYIPGSIRHISGQVPTAMTELSSPTRLQISYDVWDPTIETNSEIEFDATVVYYPSGSITNEANVEWTSLSGDLETTEQSPFNTLSTERYYDPLDDINIYGVFSSISISPPIQLPNSGFVPNIVNSLNEQPKEFAYSNLGNLRVEIPSLGIDIPIVGISKIKNTWDVSWLNHRAGFLTGTAFPTQAGLTMLTAHVYDQQGNPDVFAELDQLNWGDEFIIHADGQKYVYQVRSNKIVDPLDTSVFIQTPYDEVSLITCKGYDEITGEYAWRIVVNGVLIRIEE